MNLKPIHPDAIPRAIQKAERYRVLNEPEEAESICLDILDVDPQNQDARITLLLALTDQFQSPVGTECCNRAQELLPHLNADYERHYYMGIICERRGGAQLSQSGPGAGAMAFHLFRQAMDCYEQAERLRPPHNDDAVLRYNTCVRMIAKHHLGPPPEDRFEAVDLE